MLSTLLPLGIGLTLSLILGATVWKYFYAVFAFIGFSIALGNWIQHRSKAPDLGRRVAILLIMPVFVIFFGLFQRENMQLEETVFYGALLLDPCPG
jgi:ferredoxin-type protein NapH